MTVVVNGERREVRSDALLVSVGRAPNIEGLMLEAAGVRAAPERVLTDSSFRTSARNIFACGDLLGDHQFSHMAEVEAKIVVRNIVFPGRSKENFRIAPWTTFTDPELAHVGLTEEEARRQGVRYEVVRQPFAQDDRALVDNEAKGFVKVLTRGIGGKIVGAHILGPRAGELIQEWAFAMQHGHSIRDVADMVHVYPTLTMASQHAAQRWYERLAKEPRIDGALETYAHTIRPHRKAIGLGLLGAGLVGLGAVARGLDRKRQRRKAGD